MDRAPLFTSTLKALGITLRVNLEKIRKAVEKRTFEANSALLPTWIFQASWETRLPFSIAFGLSHATVLSLPAL